MNATTPSPGTGNLYRWLLAGVAVAGISAGCAHGPADESAVAPTADSILDASTARPANAFAAAGQDLFRIHCTSCHGESARGDGPLASELRTPPADLTRIAARRDGVFPPSEIARTIDGRFQFEAHGSREMPVWGRRFTEAVPELGLGDDVERGEVWLLVDYLETIQRR